MLDRIDGIVALRSRVAELVLVEAIRVGTVLIDVTGFLLLKDVHALRLFNPILLLVFCLLHVADRGHSVDLVRPVKELLLILWLSAYRLFVITDHQRLIVENVGI